MMTRAYRAFTLVEVLVVIGIIALLAGIVYALMGPARESSRQRVCVSNLRQIGQALRMYVDDYEGVEAERGVPMKFWQLGLPANQGVFALFKEYVRDRRVALCPSYHGDSALNSWLTTYWWEVADDQPFVPVPLHWSEKVRARGSDAVVAWCQYHNATWERDEEPRWALKTAVMLRLNGRVEARKIRVRTTPKDW